MRTELLKYIIEIDKHHSISKASNNLYISQAALSESISQFEKDLNVTIFERSKKGVTTTETGMQIINQAKVILKELDKLQHISVLAPAKINYSENLSFGLTEKFTGAALSESINWAIKKYPDLTFNIIDLSAQKCIEQVARQELDFAFVAINNFSKDATSETFHKLSLRHIPLSYDPIYVLVSKQSPLAKHNLLTHNDTKAETLISYSAMFSTMGELLTQKVMLLSNFDSIIQMVSENVGISLLPESLIAQHKSKLNDNLIAIPLAEGEQFNCIIYSAKKNLTPVQDFFINLYTHIYKEHYAFAKED